MLSPREKWALDRKLSNALLKYGERIVRRVNANIVEIVLIPQIAEYQQVKCLKNMIPRRNQ